MAAAKKAKATPSQDEITTAIEPFSKALSKSVAQIWKMFVMRYIAKGIGEVFLALFVVGIGFYYLNDVNKLFMLIPLGIGGVFVYDAIQLLINPYYFAMNDVAVRLKSEQLLWKK